MSAPAGKQKAPAYIVPALERGLRMLQAFSADRPVQSLGRLARELGVPRATAFRLADTLAHLGFLVRDEETGEYRVGAAALRLGWTYLSGLDLPEIAHPTLAGLRRRTGASVHMAVRDGRDVVYVGRLPANAALASNIRVGSRLPAHASSMGRAMLSGLGAGALAELYEGAGRLERFTDETPGSLAELRRLLAGDAANGGVVVSRGFYERGVASVAAPVRDGTGRVVAAINVTAPEGRFPEEALAGEVRGHVVAAAREISAALGHRPDGGGVVAGRGTPPAGAAPEENGGAAWTRA